MSLKSTFYIFSCSIFFSLFASCTDEPLNSCQYDIQKMNANITENIIVPDMTSFAEETKQLVQHAENFAENVNTEDFRALKGAFLNAYTAYQKISVYEFGPATENGFSLRERLNTFPTNIAAIEQNISTNESDLNSLYKTNVGFPAIEYLLYGTLENSESDILNFFTDNNNRKEYLIALANDIAQKATTISVAWQNEYGSFFASSTGNADGSALHLLCNAFNQDYEWLKNFKIKIPLGKFDNGTPQAQKAEAYHSSRSVSLAIIQLQNLHRLYKGSSDSSLEEKGLYDYLVCLNAGLDADGILADVIDNQFNTVAEKMSSLNDPFAQELETNITNVEELHLELQKMLPLIKREMTSAFGVKISYQDNDGD
ncbi:MAG: imelysin family protein [Chitinophagales bacterium]